LPRYLESEAPDAFKLAVKALEDRSDDWFRALHLSQRPWNLAFWGTMTATIEVLERVIRQRGNGSVDHKAALLNLGLIGPVILEQLRQFSLSPTTIPFRFEPALANEASIALDLAHKRIGFLYTFPFWHRDKSYAELLGTERIRFTARGGVNDRSVSAYQKGFRPPHFNHPQEEPQGPLPATERELALLVEASHTCYANGPDGFFYPRPFLLMEAFYNKYSSHLTTSFRRDLSLSLGSYSLGEFLAFYAALLALCSIHEQLCHLWSLEHSYPLNSAVMVRERASCIAACSRFSSLAPALVDGMINDLIFGTTRPLAFQVHPFVSLNDELTLLGLIPHFPLNSKPDENILRVCSYVRREVFDAASLTKEQETRRQLTALLPVAMSGRGPISLTNPTPDIDLLINDEHSSTLLVCELKWIRKPALPLENIARDVDFFKGVDQLSKIRTFLTDHPEYLKELGIITHEVTNISHVYYLLVARDHFKWIDPELGIVLVDYDVFRDAITKTSNLHNTLEELMQFEWLPKEGRDFVVRNEYAISNGIIAESETYYSPDGANNPVPIANR
jgi:hypothetical protein